jgi:hypothetical protein
MKLIAFANAVMIAFAQTGSAAALPTTQAKSAPNGLVDIDLVYYAEDTCMKFGEVKEGHPSSIEAPKKALVVTVTLDREHKGCEQKLKTLTSHITIKDRPGVKSVEIFYVGRDGKFIRSSRPRIYRAEEAGAEIE